MPTFQLLTNISKDKIPKGFLVETSGIVAKTLGKPESYVMVHVVADQNLIMGGTDAPCAIVNLMSIGKLGVQENKKHSLVLFGHIEKQLGIPKDRMYINFHDAPSSEVGFSGTTFHEIFG